MGLTLCQDSEHLCCSSSLPVGIRRLSCSKHEPWNSTQQRLVGSRQKILTQQISTVYAKNSLSGFLGAQQSVMNLGESLKTKLSCHNMPHVFSHSYTFIIFTLSLSPFHWVHSRHLHVSSFTDQKITGGQ